MHRDESEASVDPERRLILYRHVQSNGAYSQVDQGAGLPRGHDRAEPLASIVGMNQDATDGGEGLVGIANMYTRGRDEIVVTEYREARADVEQAGVVERARLIELVMEVAQRVDIALVKGPGLIALGHPQDDISEVVAVLR